MEHKFEINGKVILLGDCHFGVKKFSLEFMRNQLKLFTNQIIPICKDHGIKYLISPGDLLDNRTIMDLKYWYTLRKELFDVLKEHDLTLIVSLGNHDITLRESLEMTMLDTIKDLYPDNFVLIKEKTNVLINGQNCKFIPWLVKGDELYPTDLEKVDYLFGHFEIRSFAMVKGHIDETSKLTTDFFNTDTLKGVFSGHYHVRSQKNKILYLGTPYQLNWSDFNLSNGFYVWNEDQELAFVENESSKKFVKIKYNDEDEKPVTIEGLGEELSFNYDEFNDFKEKLSKHELKFFVNQSNDKKFEEFTYALNEAEVDYTFINNHEISKLIESDYTELFNEEADSSNLPSAKELALKTIKEQREDLVPFMNTLFMELESTMNIEE